MSLFSGRFGAFAVVLVTLALACAANARAGSLLLENYGSAAVVCQSSGYVIVCDER